MHELAIVKNIISIVEDEIEEQADKDEKVISIIFKSGKMNKIVPELLRSNFDRLKQDIRMLESAELIMEEIPVEIKCKDCQTTFKIQEPVFRCQECNSDRIEIMSGKEMFVESIQTE